MSHARLILALAIACTFASAARAQQQAPAEGQTWSQLPHMQLERQFAGPLQDTIVQRWRDPNDGTVCYIYLPISAAHTPPTASGFVQYGANNIGSISCMREAPPTPAAASAAAAPARVGRPKAPAPPIPPTH
jgi:hypothetical protein